MYMTLYRIIKHTTFLNTLCKKMDLVNYEKIIIFYKIFQTFNLSNYSPKKHTAANPTVTMVSNVKMSRSDSIFLRFRGWLIHILRDSGLQVSIKMIIEYDH